MCTVTIIPLGSGVRLACNRDESRTRPVALPPRVVTVGARRALMPIDPLSGGTWIAVNDAGLIFTLLNAYAMPRRAGMPAPGRSRGTIIPQLLGAGSLVEVLARVNALETDDFAAFRLVLADHREYAEIYSTGQAVQCTTPKIRDQPLLFTSSGLGDALVETPRRALFEEFFAASQDWLQRQDAFHRHSWPERRQLSVCMNRPEARTVSLTIAEVETRVVRMTYHGEAPDQPIQPITATLERAA